MLARQLARRKIAGAHFSRAVCAIARLLALMSTNEHSLHADDRWDAGDMGCGELVIDLRLRLRALAAGQVLRLIANDPGAREDLPAWCGMTGHTLVHAAHPVYYIRRKEN
jgi:tRNA 2-thiouridine synthesizing protein A